MTFREKTVCRILLFVAQLVAESNEVRAELVKLANHIAHGEEHERPRAATSPATH